MNPPIYKNRFNGFMINNNTHEERTYLISRIPVAYLALTVLSGSFLLVMEFLGIIEASRQPSIIITAAIILSGATLSTATYILARSERYTFAIRLFLYGMVVFVTLTVYLFGGVDSPVFTAYLVPVMVAGLLGQNGDGVRIFFLSLGFYTMLATLEMLELVKPLISFDGQTEIIIYLFTFGAIGGLLTYMSLLWSNGTARFTAQLQAQSEELLESNEQLLQKNIQQVELGSELSVAAQELLMTSHQQATGAAQQASDVTEISTTIEELGATAHQIALAAEQVASATKQTLENISEGQDAVERSIQAMERIRMRVQDVSTRVLKLGERSQQIGEVIDLINDLSDETHLLALNAAIEAVGAGEHGRRFAVVAAEVKNLANRALTAAKEVKGVIAEIQQATNAAVIAAEEGGKEVERGVDLARSAGQVMGAIVVVAERTAQSGGEISLATAQQQSASEQVVETMREVADVARQTASGARQMAESAQILTSIAEHLHGISAPIIDGSARAQSLAHL